MPEVSRQPRPVPAEAADHCVAVASASVNEGGRDLDHQTGLPASLLHSWTKSWSIWLEVEAGGKVTVDLGEWMPDQDTDTQSQQSRFDLGARTDILGNGLWRATDTVYGAFSQLRAFGCLSVVAGWFSPSSSVDRATAF